MTSCPGCGVPLGPNEACGPCAASGRVSEERVTRLRSLIARLAQLAACNDVGCIAERERLCREMGELSKGLQSGIPPNTGAGAEGPGPEHVPITRNLLVIPMYWAVAYDEAGAPICGQPGDMHRALPDHVDWAKNLLTMMTERAYLLARWIQRAKEVEGA